MHLEFDEEQAFWMLCSVVERHVGYYARSMCGLKRDQNVIADLVSYYEPQLSDHITNLGVQCDTFTVPWLLCLFVDQPIPLSQVIHFWDHLFLRGDELIFSAVLAILRIRKPQILACSQYEDLMQLFLRGMGKDLTAKMILESIDAQAKAWSGCGLMTRVERLRSYHEWQVVRGAELELDRGTISDLVKRYTTEKAEIRRLWKKFLSPSPWDILLSAGIGNLDWFVKAFPEEAYPDWHRRQWRGRGIESGALKRLFNTLDCNVSGQVNFEQYLFGVYVLKRGESKMRKQLAFEFCDLDADGAVSRADLRMSLVVIHRLYNGEDSLSEESEVDKFVEAMFEFALLTNKATHSRKLNPLRAMTPRVETKTAIAGRNNNSTRAQSGPGKLGGGARDATRNFLERKKFRSLKSRLSPKEFGRAVDQHPLIRLFFNLHDDAEVKKLRSDLIAEAKTPFAPPM